MSTIVYVLNRRGEPLMPCKPQRARKLLQSGGAYVVRKDPFTIKLRYTTSNYTQPLRIGIDSGSKNVGSAVVDEKNNVYYMSEVALRDNVSDNMTRRAMYRRTRRTRKTRYRPARFLNRRNSIRLGRYAPSIRSKFDSHVKEIEFICKLLPIVDMHIEVGQFDPHLMQKPWLKHYPWMYQRGNAAGYVNTAQYVLARDNYKCQHCLGKKKDSKLQIHHIVYRSQGGVDVASNLVTLCSTCHKKHHVGNMKLHSRIAKAVKSTLKHATHMNVIGSMLRKKYGQCSNVTFTYGYITKTIRRMFDFKKSHFIDAVCIAMQADKMIKLLSENVVIKACHARGNYRRTDGRHSQRMMLPKKVKGFRMHDKVRKNGEIAYIIGRRKTGSCGVKNLFGVRLDWEAVRSTTERLQAATSWRIESIHHQYV